MGWGLEVQLLTVRHLRDSTLRLQKPGRPCLWPYLSWQAADEFKEGPKKDTRTHHVVVTLLPPKEGFGENAFSAVAASTRVLKSGSCSGRPCFPKHCRAQRR